MVNKESEAIVSAEDNTGSQGASIYGTENARRWARAMGDFTSNDQPLDMSYIKQARNRTYRTAVLLQLTPKGHRPHCAECGMTDHRVFILIDAGERGDMPESSSFRDSYSKYDWVLSHPGSYALVCRNCSYLINREWASAVSIIDKSNRRINAALGLRPEDVGGDITQVNEPYLDGKGSSRVEANRARDRQTFLLDHPEIIMSLMDHWKKRGGEILSDRLASYALRGQDWGQLDPTLQRSAMKASKLIDRMAARQAREQARSAT